MYDITRSMLMVHVQGFIQDLQFWGGGGGTQNFWHLCDGVHKQTPSWGVWGPPFQIVHTGFTVWGGGGGGGGGNSKRLAFM